MPGYRIELRPAARRSLSGLPAEAQRAIRQRIDGLAAHPFAAGVKKLAGTDFFRVRAGNYRIIYQVRDRELLVLVVKIGHRKDVYR